MLPEKEPDVRSDPGEREDQAGGQRARRADPPRTGSRGRGEGTGHRHATRKVCY